MKGREGRNAHQQKPDKFSQVVYPCMHGDDP